MKNTLVPATEVAKALGTTHRGVVLAIENGTLPIGMAARSERGRYIVKIPRARWEAWLEGKDLEK